MSRYAVPVVLALWAVSLALGCDWRAAGIVALAIAIGVQGVGQARTYRDHHRRCL